MGERVEAELPAHDRGGGEQAPAAVGEAPHALSDDHADPRRDAQMRSGLGETALGVEQAHHLGDEERIALGLGMDRLHQPRRRLDARGALDVARQVGLVQARQLDLGGLRLANQLGERGDERSLEGGIHVAEGAEHEQATPGQLASDEAQQQQ